MSERVIIKLGGSILSPKIDQIESSQSIDIPFDFAYANKLLDVIAESNQNFVIIIGGGYLNRWFLPKVKAHLNTKESVVKTNDLHHIGIASGIINSSIFHALAVDKLGEEQLFEQVIKYTEYESLTEQKEMLLSKKVIIGSGRKPGHSHDVDALFFAALFGTNQILSFKNIDGIYSADPQEFPDAQKRKMLTWNEYRSIIKSDEHKPGASYPIDPIAATLAERMHMGFTVLDGRDFDAVRESINTRLCSKGSTILPD